MAVWRVALLLVLVISAASAEPLVTALRADAPPALDGSLDDPLWQQATWQSGFTMLGEVERVAEAQTHFAVAFDSANLYIAIRCDEPAMDQLKASVTERDGKVHSDDCVEIMIAPNAARTEYYHLSLNPLGTLYDAQMRQGGNVRAVQWDCGWQAAMGRGPDFWTAEIAVPLVELELTEASRDAWAINVARERKAGKAELSSFTPAPGGFHQPTYYAQLDLPEADLGRFIWTVRDPFDGAARMDGGQIVYNAKTHITNQTGRLWLLQLIPELVSGESVSTGAAVNLGLDNGQGREVAFTVPVAEQGRQVLRLRLVDRRDPTRVLYVRSIPTSVQYTPLAIEMTRPAYRNSIYATQQIDAVELLVRSALTDEQLDGKRLAAGIFRPAEGDQAPQTQVVAAEPIAAAGEATVAIPAADLPVGDYQVAVQLVDAAGAVEHVAQTELRKLPPAPGGHEWRIDENNVLLHNGEPFLPFGWFSYSLAEHTPDAPYTAMQEYNAHYRTVEENAALLDQIADAGLFVTIYPYSRAFMNQGEVVKQPLTEEEAAALRERVTGLMDHRGLLAWYMADEPELKPVLPSRAEQIYQVCRDADPYHPCIMLNDTIAGIHTYAGGGDILMPDPYPLFLKDGLAARGIEHTSEFIKACREATGGRKPAWVTPQAFNYGNYGRAGNRGPNFTELRNQCYQAVVYGAKGFLWYTYGQANNYPDLGIGMDYLCREALDLQDAILATDAEDQPTVEAEHPEHLHVTARRVDDELFIFAVNTATEPQQARIALGAMPERLYVVSEGREAEVAGGAIADSFGIYETHIYSTDAAVAERPTIASIQQQIDEANAARSKPGNLAFEEHAAEVEVSSGAQYSNTPTLVMDGIETHLGWRADAAAAGEQWLTLRWPEAQTFGRVVVYSTSVRALTVQVPGDGEGDWRDVAQMTGEGRLEVTFPPVTAVAVRLLVTELAEDATAAAIQEVEVYAQ